MFAFHVFAKHLSFFAISFSSEGYYGTRNDSSTTSVTVHKNIVQLIK